MSTPVLLPCGDSDSGEECGSPAEPSPSTHSLHVCTSDSSDDNWLSEICRVPRKSLHITSSDEVWAETLCRSRPSHLEAHGGISPGQTSSPLHLEAHGGISPGQTSSPSHLEAHGGVSPCQTSSPSHLEAHGGVSPGQTSFAGPYTALRELRSEVAVYMRLPEPLWPLPAQDSIVDETRSQSFGASSSPMSAKQSIIGKCCWRFVAWSYVLRDIFVFKIGIAYDPVHRWWNREFGYVGEQTWQFMDVMHAGSPTECCWLERALIFRLGSIPGCHNGSAGGEGISAVTSEATGESPVCHCYIVYAPAGSGVGLRAAFLSRKRQRTTQRFPNVSPVLL